MLNPIADIDSFLAKSKCCSAKAAQSFVESSQSGKLSQIKKIGVVRGNIYRIMILEGAFSLAGCISPSEAVLVANMIDCPCCDDQADSNGLCDLESLSVGWCYNSAPPGSVDVIVADGSVSIPVYESYYYEYYIGGSELGPWAIGSDSNSNIANIDLSEFNSEDSWARVVAKCSQDSNYQVEFISQFKDIGGNSLSNNTFGYYLYQGQDDPVQIPNIWPMRQSDIITVLNLNDDFTMSLITNLTTGIPISGPSNIVSIDVDSGTPNAISDYDVISISFSYNDQSLFSCPIKKIVSARVIPDPVILFEEEILLPGVLCPGTTLTMAISNYPYDSYQWSNGSDQTSIEVDEPGTYTCICTFMGIQVIASTTLVAGNPSASPALVNDTTGIQIPLYNEFCPPSFIDIRISDTGLYSGGWPSGTQFLWTDQSGGILVPLGPFDVVQSNNIGSSSLICTVYIPGECPVSTPVYTIINKFFALNISKSNPSFCNPFGGTATVNVTVAAPSGPYLFKWSTDFAQTNIIRQVSTSTLTDSISGLSAGTVVPLAPPPAATYFVSVSDAAGCSSGVSLISMVGSSFMLPLITKTNVTCNGASDGTANVSVSGGRAPYTYLWSNGATTSSISSLPPGTYSLVVTDADGCTASGSVSVTQPALISSTISLTPPLTLSASISGGTTPYTSIEWYDGSLNLIGSGTSVTVSGPGTYTLLVVDFNGCNHTNTRTV